MGVRGSRPNSGVNSGVPALRPGSWGGRVTQDARGFSGASETLCCSRTAFLNTETAEQVSVFLFLSQARPYPAGAGEPAEPSAGRCRGLADGPGATLGLLPTVSLCRSAQGGISPSSFSRPRAQLVQPKIRSRQVAQWIPPVSTYAGPRP